MIQAGRFIHKGKPLGQDHRKSPLVRATAGGVLALIVLFTPIAMDGRLRESVGVYTTSVDTFPARSLNAWNIWTIANQSLLPKANSWYMGDNIPGKTREPLIYLGGVPTYYKFINDCAVSNYEGFKLE